MKITYNFSGLEELTANIETLSKATRRNAAQRVLKKAGEPIAATAARLAPVERGVLSFSIVVSTQLTRRAKAALGRENEAEVYIGPSGGLGALYYATQQEFGTVVMPAHPYLRPAWESEKNNALQIIIAELTDEVEKSAQRAARKRLKG